MQCITHCVINIAGSITKWLEKSPTLIFDSRSFSCLWHILIEEACEYIYLFLDLCKCAQSTSPEAPVWHPVIHAVQCMPVSQNPNTAQFPEGAPDKAGIISQRFPRASAMCGRNQCVQGHSPGVTGLGRFGDPAGVCSASRARKSGSWAGPAQAGEGSSFLQPLDCTDGQT